MIIGIKQAMNEEIHEIEKNKTQELTSLPLGKKLNCIKMVNKIKYKSTGEVDYYKERFMVKRHKQKTGIDYFEVLLLDRLSMLV